MAASDRKSLIDNFKAAKAGELHLVYGLELFRTQVLPALKKEVGDDQPIIVDALNTQLLSGVPTQNHRVNAAAVKYHKEKVIDKLTTTGGWERIKEACTLALHEYYIHFLLRGIKAADVFTPGSKHYDSCTSEELRHAHTHYQEPGCRIRFYELDEQPDPSKTPTSQEKAVYEETCAGKRYVEVDIEKWIKRQNLTAAPTAAEKLMKSSPSQLGGAAILAGLSPLPGATLSPALALPRSNGSNAGSPALSPLPTTTAAKGIGAADMAETPEGSPALPSSTLTTSARSLNSAGHFAMPAAGAAAANSASRTWHNNRPSV